MKALLPCLRYIDPSKGVRRLLEPSRGFRLVRGNSIFVLVRYEMDTNGQQNGQQNRHKEEDRPLTQEEVLMLALIDEYYRLVELWCGALNLEPSEIRTFCRRFVIHNPEWEDSDDPNGSDELKEMLLDAFFYKDKAIASFSITSDRRYCVKLYYLDAENSLAHRCYGRRTLTRCDLI